MASQSTVSSQTTIGLVFPNEIERPLRYPSPIAKAAACDPVAIVDDAFASIQQGPRMPREGLGR